MKTISETERPLTGSALREEVNRAYIDHIREHRDENREGALAVRERVYHSSLFNGERVIDVPLCIPKIFSGEDWERFREAAKTTHSICCKMIRHYLDDPAYRALFPYPAEMESLILTESGYDSLLPMARFDIFYNEETGDFKFCEINTDGTSAMNEQYELDRAFFVNPAHQAVLREYELENEDLFTPWVDTFLRLYETRNDTQTKTRAEAESGGARCLPNVAIADFLDRGVVREFEEFARRFQMAGVLCQIADPREMTYQDGILYSKEGWPIDAIYRRAVTADVMQRLNECPAFLQAVRDGNVFLCGAFRTQVVHTKWTFLAMHMAETKRFLDDSEIAFIEAHIPRTYDMNEPGKSAAGSSVSAGTASYDGVRIAKKDVLANKDAWIIKPYDDYGSHGVLAGVTCTQKEWEAAVDEAYGRGYICQEYCEQYATTNIDLAADGDFAPYINMTGLYCYDGEFAGVFARQSEGGIIASHHNELDVPAYVVRGKR